MKLQVMFGWMGLMVASVAFAQTATPPAPDGTKPTPPPVAPAVPKADGTAAKKDDAKAAAAKKAAAATKKKEEPPPSVEGLAIIRPKGGFLGLQVVNGNFLLTFYDAKKKKIAPDVDRAALRWPVKYQPGPERTVLNPGGGPFSLTSAKSVRPPLVFRVFISLLVEGSEEPVESYTVEYHGE